jgi:selenoprotein W-related protein
LAAELSRAFPEVEVQLIPSSGGRFEVTQDQQLVFSKAATRRHAEPGEVVKLIKQVRGER